jgi:hypothetical protein
MKYNSMVRFEVHTAVVMNSSVLWDMTPPVFRVEEYAK